MASLRTVNWPVQTARLQIRPLEDADLPAVWGFRKLPDVSRWLGRAPQTQQAFNETYSDPRRRATTLVIELLDPQDGSPTIVGDLMVKIEDAWAQAEVANAAQDTVAELGWVIAPSHSRRGYALEAVSAVIDICFGTLALRRVHAGCFAANEPSWRLMERLGMRREEYSRGSALHRSGEWMDGMNYGLLADEWPGRR